MAVLPVYILSILFLEGKPIYPDLIRICPFLNRMWSIISRPEREIKMKNPYNIEEFLFYSFMA
jgi:hypothetical protein